jgi:hypothetical protein
MDLTGGLDMYAPIGTRYREEASPEGRKVYFLDRGGYDIQREHANKFFKKGDELTVKEIYVGRSSSEVEFVEFPGHRFNTVMFADIVEIEEELI